MGSAHMQAIDLNNEWCRIEKYEVPGRVEMLGFRA